MDNEKVLEKHIIGENGISYTLGEDGLYYPNLELPEETHYEIGQYGLMRCEFLKKHRRGEYIRLLVDGKLNEHLHEVDEECHERVELLMEQMKAGAGITEELKAIDQMKWGGLMNNVKSAAEEIVAKEIIYM
ncbi:MAG: TnpV protein [Agathobacter sp.]|nr:TnpV protein [Agathobacter sp.]